MRSRLPQIVDNAAESPPRVGRSKRLPLCHHCTASVCSPWKPKRAASLLRRARRDVATWRATSAAAYASCASSGALWATHCQHLASCTSAAIPSQGGGTATMTSGRDAISTVTACVAAARHSSVDSQRVTTTKPSASVGRVTASSGAATSA